MSLMSLGLRAMAASYAQLQTTGHNIANSNVEGYSRQDVTLATAAGQFTGAGFFGRGVDVVSVQRAHDQFLTMQANVAKSLAGMDSTRADRMGQLETVFPPGENGIGYAIGDFLNALSDVANLPSDLSARAVVLARADEVAQRFASAGAQIQSQQAGVTQDLQTSVASVNSLTEHIADLNDQIATYQGVGQSPNDLLDARDKAVHDLSGYLQISTIEADDGSLTVFAGGGQRLVIGDKAEALAVMPDASDSSRSAIGIVESGQARRLDGSIFSGGGSIAGLLRFQNDDLVSARNLLGQMAASLAQKVNDAQANGLDLGVPARTGAPIFSTAQPEALPSASNAKDSAGVYLSSVSLTVVDATRLQASDYDLRADPGGAAGAYQLTRLSDGAVSTVANGDTVDGMRIDIGPPAPGPDDRFLLQPVGNAARSMQSVLHEAQGLAAALPMTAATGAGNTGTATVAAFGFDAASADTSLSSSIAFTSGTGNYDWELRDSSGVLVSSGSGQWTAGQPIVLNGASLTLDGVPAAGDTVAVTKTLQPATNNGNALAMLALRDERVVGVGVDANVSGSTLTDAYASAMADIGVRSQTATLASQMSAAGEAQAESAVSSSSGVNLDEEAAKLIQYQQSYQAAAKVLTTAQAIFDTLLQIGG